MTRSYTHTETENMPTVKVVGYTQFLGVPSELNPEQYGAAGYDYMEAYQNQGTDMERLVECAGRTCYDSYGRGRHSDEYHGHIREVGHGSVMAHASISFYISGISRGCSHELVRHGVGIGISQRSTRYVDESESANIWHPLIYAYARERGTLISGADIDGALARLTTQTSELYKLIAQGLENWLAEKGVDRQTARKQARGAARGVLPNALETSMLWTANIRALRNVLEQRASRFADAEIRLLANALYEAAYEYAPNLLDDYDKSPCPDGIGYELTTLFRKV
jgi:thymidylate synthase (FAD)